MKRNKKKTDYINWIHTYIVFFFEKDLIALHIVKINTERMCDTSEQLHTSSMNITNWAKKNVINTEKYEEFWWIENEIQTPNALLHIKASHIFTHRQHEKWSCEMTP